MRFFEDGFDYKKYIDERLLEIGDLDKRSQIRNAVGGMLLPFYEHIEESYRNIEDRMFAARSENQGNFQIVTGIEERNRIDVTDTTMVPMRMEDMEEKKTSIISDFIITKCRVLNCFPGAYWQLQYIKADV